MVPPAHPFACISMGSVDLIIERPGAAAIPIVLTGPSPAAEINSYRRVIFAVSIIRAEECVGMIGRIRTFLPEGDSYCCTDFREQIGGIGNFNRIFEAVKADCLAVHALGISRFSYLATEGVAGAVIKVVFKFVPGYRCVWNGHRIHIVSCIEPAICHFFKVFEIHETIVIKIGIQHVFFQASGRV